MKKSKKTMSKTSDKELSEADLEKISGGVGHGNVASSSSSSNKKKSTHGSGTGQSNTGTGNPLTKSKSN